ncbi:MAG TPA: IS3 family transposase [Pyrinomonadaceae bacterium]|nr:IS3 family transposase [Pyrinomonadaceae bacterium]
MQMQGNEGPTLRQMCETAAVSRAGYYRSWRKKEPRIEETALRDAIQKEALSRRHRGGYRPITRALKNNGWVVNHKRVLRLMREDNLLSMRRRRFVVTTDSDHSWRVYPNLACRMVVSDINQLWVADITYVRLQQEFIYLAVILDVYSRRVIGWNLSRRLERGVATQALEMALAERRPAPGLVHHSDRGVQYASGDYVKRLESCGITISMSRPGNPWDNAWAESFIKTLKVEEVNGRRYLDFDHAKTCIGTFIEEVYNQQRMHSALNYDSPVEFENRRPVETAAAEEIVKGRFAASTL